MGERTMVSNTYISWQGRWYFGWGIHKTVRPIRMPYIGGGNLNTEGSLTGDRWAQLTPLVTIVSRTTLTQNYLSVSSAVVNRLFSSMSKRVGEYFVIGWREAEANSSLWTACGKISDRKAAMDYHAVPPPEYRAGDESKREKCVSKILKESPERSQEHQAPDNWKRLEYQAPGDQLLRKMCQVKRKFIFIQILMERRSVSSAILQRMSGRRARSTNFTENYWTVYVRNFGRHLIMSNAHVYNKCPFSMWLEPWCGRMSWSQGIDGCAHTQDSRQEVLKQCEWWVGTWWSRNTLMSDPAANWSGWKFTCSQTLHCVLESPIEILPIAGQQHWREHGTWIRRNIEFGMHLASATKRFYHSNHETYSGTLERTNSRIFLWEDHIHVCVHNAPKVSAFAAQFKQGQWTASENRWWNGNSNEPQGQWPVVALQVLDIFTCHTSHPIFPATEPLSHGQLRKGGSNYRFKGTFDNHMDEQISTYSQSNLPPVWDWKSGTHTENIGRLRANRSRTRAVDFDYAKTANNTTSSRLNTIRTTNFLAETDRQHPEASISFRRPRAQETRRHLPVWF